MSTVVFVHAGAEIPAYLATAMTQARAFSDKPVVLIANAQAISSFGPLSRDLAEVCACEDLEPSAAHRAFRDITPFDASVRNGFWVYTTERFFYLAEFAAAASCRDIVHLESDVMLYADVPDLTGRLSALYPGLAAPFDHDDRCIPSLVYAAGAAALATLERVIIAEIEAALPKRLNDMALLAKAERALGAAAFGSLPVVPASYTGPFRNRMGETPTTPARYSRNVEALGVIFDAAAIGQFLGGVDPRNVPRVKRSWYQKILGLKPRTTGTAPGAGFVNEVSFYDPSLLTYAWKADGVGRMVPHAVHAGQATPIANLHIHSKDLAAFAR